MVVVPSRVGQLGNQLFHIAHFAASSMEYGYRFRFAAFEYPLEHFPMLNSHACIRVSQVSKRRNLCQHRLFKLLKVTLNRSPLHRCLTSSWPDQYNMCDDEFISCALKNLVLCQGFAFRDFKQVKKHHAELVRLFRMSEFIRNEVENFEAVHFPMTNTIRVGFHIRRGDYKDYANGKYYIHDDQWHHTINMVKNDIEAKGGNFKGVLFSNENTDALVAGSNDLIQAPGGLFADMEMLSRCDLIVAPPSTYSGWASFIGRVPLIHISAADTMLPVAEIVNG
jgi:hypothetical protein